MVGEQAVDLQQEFFADGDEVGLGDVVQPAERFDEAGQDAAAVEVGEFEQGVEQVAQAVEAEEADEKFALVGQAIKGEAGGVGGARGHLADVIGDGGVGDDAAGPEGLAQDEAFEGLATGEGDIDLAVGKGGVGVHDGALEGEPLAFVDGDGPGELERDLLEGAFDGFGDALGGGIDRVLHVVPLHGRDGNVARVAGAADADGAVFDGRDAAELAVEEALVGRGVVLDEQDLRADLEFDPRIDGKRQLGESAVDFGGETDGGTGKGGELGIVEALGLRVVGAKSNVAVAVGGRKTRHVAAVELGERFRREAVFADGVEKVEETAVLLAVDLGEFDAGVIGFAQGAAAEEIGGVVEGAQQLPLVVLHDGCELLQVADQQELDAAEGFAAVAVAAQDAVDGVEEIGAHHADFVDDEQVHAADHRDLVAGEAEVLLFAFAAGQRAEGELEERVEGDAAGIDGGHAGGGDDDHLLGQAVLQRAQKGGFARARLAGQEQGASGMPQEVEGELPRRIGAFGNLHGASMRRRPPDCNTELAFIMRELTENEGRSTFRPSSVMTGKQRCVRSAPI